MNRPERHHLRRRAEGRRRVGWATEWTAATGGVLTAVFGLAFAYDTPAATAAPTAVASAASDDNPVPVAAPVAPPSTEPPSTVAPHRHHSSPTATLQPPAIAPKPSTGGSRHASSGAS